MQEAFSFLPAFLIHPPGFLVSRLSKKNAGRLLGHPAFCVDLQQRLNCALLVVFSLSLDFFRYRGLNGMSEIPKNFGVSRRPSASGNYFIPNFSVSDFQDFSFCLLRFSLERR